MPTLTSKCSGVPVYVGEQAEAPPLICFNGSSERGMRVGEKGQEELGVKNRSWSVCQRLAEEKARQVTAAGGLGTCLNFLPD